MIRRKRHEKIVRLHESLARVFERSISAREVELALDQGLDLRLWVEGRRPKTMGDWIEFRRQHGDDIRRFEANRDRAKAERGLAPTPDVPGEPRQKGDT